MDRTQFSHAPDLRNVRVDGAFLGGYAELVRTRVVPYQWEALGDRVPDAEPSYCMRNFRAAAGMEDSPHGGFVFQDSDWSKWIEAVGYSLMNKPDPELERVADASIDLVCAAQQPDGYLDTYYILSGLDKRWSNLMDNHELYCLGHMIEGAVAYYRATGKDKLLKAVVRFVEHVDGVFGSDEGKLKGYPGHEVIEMALVKLYDVTGDERHLNLARYFIDERGKEPLYFAKESEQRGRRSYWNEGPLGYGYYQADRPVREQHDARGHAVRATYLYSGMADVARRTGDDTLQSACENLWRSITEKQMYITGGIGSSEYGEGFTFDYDLPGDTAYAETCASIGLVFFARRMLETSPKAVYADVMERALYNGVISGMSLDGTRFFYVNPLEVLPIASERDKRRRHVKVERQKWFGCSCCPPNIARLMASIGSYAYTVSERAIYMHLFAGGALEHEIGGARVKVSVATEYPWQGAVSVRMNVDKPTAFAYAVRIPGWCKSASLTLNGHPAAYAMEDGYAVMDRMWSDGDALELNMDMPVRVVRANTRVRETIGRVAVCRGPLVYCIEEADNGSGLHRVALGDNPCFAETFEPELLGGVVTVTSQSFVEDEDSGGTLYRDDEGERFTPKALKWIPYYAWANRTPGEMTVWVRR